MEIFTNPYKSQPFDKLEMHEANLQSPIPAKQIPMTSFPYIKYGNSDTILHFAHANGFPPLVYRAFLERVAERHQVWGMGFRPIWSTEDPWTAFTSWEQFADDLITFLDSHNLRNIIGIGHSMGGVATTIAAVKRPDLFRQLILIDPVFLPPSILAMMESPAYDPMDFPLVQGALKRRDFWESREEAWERFRPKSVFSRFTDPALWDYVNAVLKPTDGGYTLTFPKTWEARIYSLVPKDVWQWLPQVTQPIIAIRAEHSDTIFPESWAYWQTLTPDATFVEVDNVGHLLLLEQPDRLADLVHTHI